MVNHKLTISGKQGEEQILLDDKPVLLKRLQLFMNAGSVNEAVLTFSNIEVDVDIETKIKENKSIYDKVDEIILNNINEET